MFELRREPRIGRTAWTPVRDVFEEREVVFWCLLTRGEDYAFPQPSLTKKKMRRLELQAGAPKGQGGRSVGSTNDAMRSAERELALQAQRAYEQTVTDWQQRGASATPGRASSGCSK